MSNLDVNQAIQTELAVGMDLEKCQKCGCMQETLDNLADFLPTIASPEVQPLIRQVTGWAQQMLPIRYECLGCDPCYPAVAQNIFTQTFPAADLASLSCNFQVVSEDWPPVVGEYFVVDKTAPVAVSTLASLDLAEDLARQQPQGLAIVGKTETENIGLDKIVKNIISNPSIRHLIVAGADSNGHQSGQTLLALAKNGVDPNKQVIGSPGKRPVLRNVSLEEIRAFREQVRVMDMIGCEILAEVVAAITDLSLQCFEPGCDCGSCGDEGSVPVSSRTPARLVAAPALAVKLDKAGYFVIVPLIDKGVINVEHYAYDHTLLHIIEGTQARDLYLDLIANGWVTELSHAAYLGKELARAELSLELGFKFIQDGA